MTKEYLTLVSNEEAQRKKINQMQEMKSKTVIVTIDKTVPRKAIMFFEELIRHSKIKFHVEVQNAQMLYIKD